VLADLAKGKMRAKIPELTEALIGHFDVGHAQLARSILGRLDAVEADLAELDDVIATSSCPPRVYTPPTTPFRTPPRRLEIIKIRWRTDP
jgi:hypothetical protein